MARRSQKGDVAELARQLTEGLDTVVGASGRSSLREQVGRLIDANHLLRDMGSSLVEGDSGMDRILAYFRENVGVALAGDELMVVAGIGEWARRIRELRVQEGWPILSGVTAAEMAEVGDESVAELPDMKAGDYILLRDQRDALVAGRWALANDIRKRSAGVKAKVLDYLRANVGEEVTGEELRYVSGDKSEWARRVRELRTEEGWPIATKTTGRPDLGIGVYVLESDKQAERHDRRIPDPVRHAVLRRDKFVCRDCGWSQDLWTPSAPLHLELHHLTAHAKGGANDSDNLITLCNVCHDDRHRRGEGDS